MFPFESAWYAKRVPKLRVEFVGHPMVERYTSEGPVTRVPDSPEMGTRVTRPSEFKDAQPNGPALLLLPGSREGELQRHLPVMLDALKMIQEKLPVNRKKIVVPNESLARTGSLLKMPGCRTPGKLQVSPPLVE